MVHVRAVRRRPGAAVDRAPYLHAANAAAACAVETAAARPLSSTTARIAESFASGGSTPRDIEREYVAESSFAAFRYAPLSPATLTTGLNDSSGSRRAAAAAAAAAAVSSNNRAFNASPSTSATSSSIAAAAAAVSDARDECSDASRELPRSTVAATGGAGGRGLGANSSSVRVLRG